MRRPVGWTIFEPQRAIDGASPQNTGSTDFALKPSDRATLDLAAYVLVHGKLESDLADWSSWRGARFSGVTRKTHLRIKENPRGIAK